MLILKTNFKKKYYFNIFLKKNILKINYEHTKKQELL
jgi:hypothetical protein